MKSYNKISHRTTFIVVWLAIGIISSAIAITFVVGLRTIFQQIFI